METPTCSHRGCVSEARFRPVWLLAFEDTFTRHRITLDMCVCEEHRREMSSLFCTARGQLSVGRALRRRLRAAPDWARSRMWFQPIH